MNEDNENVDKTGVQITLPVMNWKCFFFGLLIGLLFMLHWSGCSCSGAEPARNLEDIHAASCRVFAVDKNGRGAIGTGTICGLFQGKYYILTNWHVVESYKQVTLQFFGTGRITECKGTVIATWHNETQPYDFAIITVEQRQLSQYNPPFVPLAQRGTRPKTGGLIFSSGCSEGRWPFAWKGSVESYYGETAQFFPAPKGGQSGSAIIEEIDGQLCISGILTWRVGDEKSLSEEEMRGGAIPISKLYEAFDGKRKTGLPNSVPPYSVWCKAGNAGVSPASSESGVSPDSSPKTEAKKDSKPVKEEPKEEAIKKVDSKGKPEKDKDIAIYRVEPKTETIPKDMPIHKETEKPKVHAIGNTDDFKKAVSKKDIVEVIEFTSAYCQPCQQAKPIVEALQKQGYTIHVVQIDNDEGRKMAFERKVTGVPTFITYRSGDNRATWTEVSRFSGVSNLRERLLQSFSLGNSGGNSQRDEPLEIKPDGDRLNPLFDEYGSGWRGRWRDKPEDQMPDSGDGESGLFRSDRVNVTSLIQQFLKVVFLRAAILITIFWFVMYAALKSVNKLIGLLPKFTIKWKSDNQTGQK
jgi:thiol-disulfide isomerase/thioredoxin